MNTGVYFDNIKVNFFYEKKDIYMKKHEKNYHKQNSI